GSLGLFGMGFNIATGKLGQRTTFSTAREGDPLIKVVIDLPAMIGAGTYRAPCETLPSSPDFQHGTKVEVESWWPQSSQNHGFVRKLAAYPKAKVREQLGRRYATVLRENRVRIHVNGEPCTAFDHCVWDKERFVERVGRGKIPAQFRFNEVIHVQTRCVECEQLIDPGERQCQACKSQSFKTVEERISGWVGIQRFDDQTNFGIDLIRNGRAIRVAEKAAFFEFTDDFNVTIKDYPIDSPFGRIVGEVNLDHVAVDYTKQDFERNTDEWRRAMAYLRGESSLQPTQPNAESNHSPIFKLYQGYRRVRTPGTRDMYMGYYDQGKPKRISREIEREYYEKFLERLPGYYDDAEWWKLVLQADTPPAAELVVCPNVECGATNVKGADVCGVCGAVLIGKDCVKCGQYIAASALSCPICGSSQLPELVAPWRCQICDDVNPNDLEHCKHCGGVRSALNSASKEFLLLNSDRDDSLSLVPLTVALADGSTSTIDVRTHICRQNIVPKWNQPRIPSVSFRSADSIDIFIDTSHRLYSALHVRPEYTVAEEAADFVLQLNSRLIAQYPAQHSLANLLSTILDQNFGTTIEDSPDKVIAGAKLLFDGIRFQLSRCPPEETADLFESLSEEQAKALAAAMISQHYSLEELSAATRNSDFLKFVDDNAVVDIFRRRPRLFFDGRVFTPSYEIADMLPHLKAAAQAQMQATYLNCLEDLAQYLRIGQANALQTQRARASLDLLQSDFEMG
ncbi:MAG TPA: zinc ribbon domain-containing protein, partial [Terriglobia bacterium]|nr:zinc ribbon domain-containing protein [Terriglobia bacterium]